MFPFNRPFRRSNQNYSLLGHSQISGSLIEEIEPIMAPGLIVQFLLLLRCRCPARVQLGKKDGSEMLASIYKEGHYVGLNLYILPRLVLKCYAK